MTVRCHPDPTEVSDVEIPVPGADCTWCFNEAIEGLNRLESIMEAHGSIGSAARFGDI